MFLLVASLFFANPSPMEMPKAQAYLVKEKGVYRLEDRFDKTDLWISRAVDGQWRDEKGREFLLATLAEAVPPIAKDGPVTRADYAAGTVPIGRKDFDAVFFAVDMLSPVAPAEEFSRPHQTPRGYRDVRYYQGTNETAIVCAYLPEGAELWSFAAWTLAEGDDFGERLKMFEDEFLARERPALDERRASAAERPRRGRKALPRGERELLRADARHSVALYDAWRVTDGDEFTVLDDIGSARSFTVSLTNDLKRMRAAYAAAMPSPIDGSNVLCVARIFASREEYLDALEANDHGDMEWSAAYWSPKRRELVAYLPPDGSEKLVETIRHEAFHQYLSYAASMIPASPWLNEGYAQYFEKGPDGPETFDADGIVAFADALPGLLAMDYDEFYAGTDEARLAKYRLALSIAIFLEKGAPEVRFEPFKDVKRDYVDALLKTKDMRKATAAAFKTEDNANLFVREWTKFWKER